MNAGFLATEDPVSGCTCVLAYTPDGRSIELNGSEMDGRLVVVEPHKRMLVIIAVALSLLLTAWMAAGPLASARADVKGSYNFCSNVWVKPYGQQPNDRCVSPIGGYLYSVLVQTFEHSGCVSVLNNVGNVSEAWSCTPGGSTYASRFYVEDGIWRRGIIRNNTSGSGAHISGNQWCYTCG